MSNNYKIFISYANSDKAVAEHFLDFFKTAGSIEHSKIYFAAKPDSQIEGGKSCLEEIFEALNNSEYTFVLLSHNYVTSFNCAMELGASMNIKGRKHIFMTIPPYSHENSPTFLKGIQFNGAVTDITKLNDLRDHLSKCLDEKNAKTSLWNTKACDLARVLQDVIKDIPKSTHVKREIADELTKDVEKYKQKFAQAEEKIKKIEAENSALRNIKDKEDVKTVDARSNALSEQLSVLANDVTNALRGLSQFVIEAIYTDYAKAPQTAYDSDTDKNDFAHAVQCGYIYEDDGSLNTNNRKISKVINYLNKLENFIKEHENDTFIQDICDEQECEPSLKDRIFWNYFFG